MTTTITDVDIRHHVVRMTDAAHGAYDVDGIVATIIERHGRIDIGAINSADDPDLSASLWSIVADHDRSDVDTAER